MSDGDDVHDILGLDEDDCIWEALEQDAPDARLDREAWYEHRCGCGCRQRVEHGVYCVEELVRSYGEGE